MKITIIGIRGIPVVYSGYETFTEVLATALVKSRYKITVYCRSPYIKQEIKQYKGVDLITLPTIRSKNLDTFVHSFFSTIHACMFGHYDIIYYLGVGSTIFSFLPRIFGIKTVVNVDGFDWKREKWGWFAKKYLKFSEYLATVFPNAIVTDSLFIKKYYIEKYKKNSFYIPYGGFSKRINDLSIFNKYKIQKSKYFVWNGRIVPDNHIEELINAFKVLKTTFKCLILGDDLYKSSYKEIIQDLVKDDKRIIFTGFVSHDTAAAIVQNSYAYVETKRSGGTHPSLIEAMGSGCLIISNNCKANRQILGTSALFYNGQKGARDLLVKMRFALNPQFTKRADKLMINVKRRALLSYGWDRIIKKYKRLFSLLVNNKNKKLTRNYS